jgi:exopolysaccharide biosynthesis protein
MIATVIGYIVIGIILIAILSIPYIISYAIACKYAETLPEEERERFWSDYYLELNKHNEGGIV